MIRWIKLFFWIKDLIPLLWGSLDVWLKRVIFFLFSSSLFLWSENIMQALLMSPVKKTDRNQVSQRLWKIEGLSVVWSLESSCVARSGWLIPTQQITKSSSCPAITDALWELPQALSGRVTLSSFSKTSSSKSCWGVLEAQVRLVLGPRSGVVRKMNTWLGPPLRYIYRVITLGLTACSCRA